MQKLKFCVMQRHEFCVMQNLKQRKSSRMLQSTLCCP